MTLTDKQREQLAEAIPDDAVAEREAFGSGTVSYVEGWWVIAELNRILGPDGWSFSILSREMSEPVHERRTKKGPRPACSYIVTGRIELACGASREDVGFGSGIGTTPGDAIESAVKEAATDCLKRCARQLGHRTGGALYDKQQRHVKPAPHPALAELDDLGARVVDQKAGKDDVHTWIYENRAKLIKLAKKAGADGAKRVDVDDWAEVRKAMHDLIALVSKEDPEKVASAWVRQAPGSAPKKESAA